MLEQADAASALDNVREHFDTSYAALRITRQLISSSKLSMNPNKHTLVLWTDFDLAQADPLDSTRESLKIRAIDHNTCIIIFPPETRVLHCLRLLDIIRPS